MEKIKNIPTPELESRGIVADQKSLDSRSIVAKVEKPKAKTSEAQRKAIAKYEENFKRINCRLTPEMYQRIQNTGKSANTVIVEALTAYFAEK